MTWFVCKLSHKCVSVDSWWGLQEPPEPNQDKLRKKAWFTVKIAGSKAPISWQPWPFMLLQDRMFCYHFGITKLNEIYSQQGQKVVINVTKKGPDLDFRSLLWCNSHKNECLWSKCQLNSSQLPSHIRVLLERILDFNGLLESAQPSLKLQLTPDYHSWTQAKLTLDTFTAACQYNLQTAGSKISYPDFKMATE